MRDEMKCYEGRKLDKGLIYCLNIHPWDLFCQSPVGTKRPEHSMYTIPDTEHIERDIFNTAKVSYQTRFCLKYCISHHG